MSDIISEAAVALQLGIIIAVGAFVVISVGVALFDWGQTNGETVVQSISQLCGLEDKLYETLEQSFVNDMPDGWSKLAAQRILERENVSDYDYQLFLDGLSIDQKKNLKIDVLTLSCNFVK